MTKTAFRYTSIENAGVAGLEGSSSGAPAKPSTDPVDGDGQAALDAAVRVAVRILAQNPATTPMPQNNQRQPNRRSSSVQALGKAQVQLQDGDAQRSHREGVAKGVSHA